jgi:PAS domain S-box-containing protein
MPPSADIDGDDWEQWPCSLLRVDERGLIVSANAHFRQRTGYRELDVTARMRWTDLLAAGSRLLFETQLAAVLALSGELQEVMIDVIDTDGQRMPALMNAESITTVDGRPAGTRIALMTVPDRREYENTLRNAREEAERANALNTQARARLELQSVASAALASSVDVDVALSRLAHTLVKQVADWCIIYALDDSHPEAPSHWAAAHADPAKQPLLNELAEALPRHSTPESALQRVLKENASILLPRISREYRERSTNSPVVLALFDELDVDSALVIPSRARGQRVAALVLVRGANRTPFTDDDLADLTDLATRTGIAIDNLRRYAVEHSNSAALQQAMLTPPPNIEPFTIVTRYLPATDGAEVGGDWYDAFAQPGGGVAIAIGDVVGHDIHAAAAMGQLRGIIRTIANAIAGTPADTLGRADRAAESLQVKTLATAILAQVEPEPSDPTGGRIVIWSNAGHPPPILVSRTGGVRVLAEPPDPMLGAHVSAVRRDRTTDMHVGDTLLLYTDGLIERRDEDIDVGLARLAASVSHGHEMPLTELCDVILAQCSSGHQDDIALLALRITD